MAAPPAGGHDGTMLFAIVLALTIGCVAFILARETKPAAGSGQVSPAAAGGQVNRVLRPDGPPPAPVRGPTRAGGWVLLLLPIALAPAVMAGGAHGLIPAELGVAVLAIVFAPKLAAKLVPYGVLGLAVFGFQLAKMYRDGFTNQVQYLFVHAGPDTWDGGAAPVLAEAGVLLAVGLWLLLRLDAPGTGLVKALAAGWLASGRRGISGPQALLLIPVVGLAMQLLGPGNWFGFQAVDGLDVALIDLAVASATLVLIFRSRAWAATLAAAGLLVLGAYGWVIAVFWPAVPWFAYGVSDLHNNLVPPPLRADALQGSLLLAAGLWLAPRVMRHHLTDVPDPELAARA